MIRYNNPTAWPEIISRKMQKISNEQKEALISLEKSTIYMYGFV